MTAGPRPPRAPLPLREAAGPLAVIAALAAAAAVSAACWVAGHAAADPPAAAPAFGAPTWRALITAAGSGRLDALIGAGGSRPAFWGVLAAIVLPVAALVVLALAWSRTRDGRPGSAAAALGGRRALRDMRGRAARRRAVQLRPSLAGRDEIDDRDLGLCLGRAGGRPIFASEEDVVLMIAGPRSNKTSALVVPAILSAPGPVIATSNKPDVYTLTSRLRAGLGRVFVADPQRVVGAEQTWWWDPLADITDIAEATQLIAHFSATVGAGSERADPYWSRGGERLLAQVTLAAAVTPGRSLRDVRRWLATRDEEPAELLRTRGLDADAAELQRALDFPYEPDTPGEPGATGGADGEVQRRGPYADAADALQGTIEAPSEQRGGLFETALAAIACLESEAVTRLVTPPHTWVRRPTGPVERFDPWQFLVGYRRDHNDEPVPRDTLYLFTREGAGSAAPVIAAMVEHTLRVAARAASAQGGRLDPPLRPVLDEAANICPIKNLPDLYSYFGSMSIQVITFLQSYTQGIPLWGKAGMDKLWSAATNKLIGAGVADPEFSENLSRLVGQHDVPTWSHQHGSGGSSRTMSTRRDPILAGADIAAMPKTHALMISAGRRPAQIELMPWYDEGDADTITEHAAVAASEVRAAAIASLGPDNPLAQLLTARENATTRNTSGGRSGGGAGGAS